jgi:hypothetical protein
MEPIPCQADLSPDERRGQELFLRYVMPELHALVTRVGQFATERQRTKSEIEAWLIAEMRKALAAGRAAIDASGELVRGSRLDAQLDGALEEIGKRWAGAALSRFH